MSTRVASMSCIEAKRMSTGNFQNVVVHFKRALALLQNVKTCQACKSEPGAHHPRRQPDEVEARQTARRGARPLSRQSARGSWLYLLP